LDPNIVYNTTKFVAAKSGAGLPGQLLDLNHYKFGWHQRRESNQDIHDPLIDISLRGRFAIALYKVGLIGSLPLERTLLKELLHK
jgi:hypothetical protein